MTHDGRCKKKIVIYEFSSDLYTWINLRNNDKKTILTMLRDGEKSLLKWDGKKT